ncbi:TonB-dependent receptor [Sunxiuqinia indica]|uniref:TonB-dependent receptor n=1 Tax=Sunxiuqinia indica TaxID=2692584 RepID=UPI001358C656|nr:TonB-dependent receptor [Sunxiuqinia indica]
MKKKRNPFMGIGEPILWVKFLITMKLTIVLSLLLVVQSFAIQTYSQETTLNLNVYDVSIKNVLKEIENQSKFYFLYNDDLIDVSRKVNINVQNSNIEDILNQVLKKQKIGYVIKGRQIVLSPLAEKDYLALLQDITVGGKVSDSSGDPLPGVTVVIKGTTKGTITDSNGNYELTNVSPNQVLVFSFVGMRSQEIPVKGKQQINVMLGEETIGLKDVVVVGYGTQTKTMVSTAISSIDSEKLSSIPVTSPAEAMVGQIAGVRFQQASGDPGSAPYIRIRGNGSLTSSNSPLFVIDGYPTDDASLFNAILPNDIESIDVLKDAASAAIYGSRAGNGVILVTTKQGKLGKTKFTFDATTGIQQVTQRYEMAGPELFAEVAKESRVNSGLDIPDFLNQPERWANTDWQDVIFRTAPFQNFQIGASGGSEKMNFNISFGYLDNQGVLVNSFEKRYSMRASFNSMLTKKLEVGVNIAPTYSVVRSQNTSGGNTRSGVTGVLADALNNIPMLPVWKENGDYYVNIQDDEMKAIFNTKVSNPLNKLDAYRDFTYSIMQTANTFISYTPIEGLTLKSTFNVGYTNFRNEMYTEAFLALGNGNTGNISTPNLAQITAKRTNVTNLNWYWSNTATYDFKLGNKNLFTALLGYDTSKQENYSLEVTPRTDADNPVAFINTNIKSVAGAVLTSGASLKDEYVFDAFFARVNYSYDRKYLLSASIRKDRSSRFGPNNRDGIFPSVSAAWNISREQFMEEQKLFSTAKVRLSYGETGNDRLSGSYPWLTILNKDYYNFGTVDARVLTYAPSGFSNANLGWEKNKQFDMGIDIGVLKNRLNLNIDVYERNSNTIIEASIPTINGKASSALQNIGNVQNKGVEITLNSKNFTEIFHWQTDFNISFNKNKITELNGDAKVFGTEDGYIRNYLGRPMADIYAYKVIGTFNNEQDLIDYAQFGTQGIGDLRFEDVTGPDGVPDGKIDGNDMTLIGNAQPNFVCGLTNTFQYKSFDLNIILDGSYGGYVVNQFERAITLNRHLENMTASSAKNRWQSEENPGDGKTPRAGSQHLSTNITTNSRYVYKTNFLRIRNVSLGYTLPRSTLQKLKIQNMRIFLTVANLYTFTKYPGWNPEGNTNGDNATSNGYDIGAYPVSRNSSLGINLSF